jgi:hypothetical protein
LDSLGTFADRFERARAKAVGLFEALEGTGRFELQSLPSGTNVFRLGIGAADAEQFRDRLREGWNIRVREPGPDGLIRLYVNETQMRQGNDRLVEAFEDAHRAAS